MANCHRNFLKAKESFHSKISLDDKKKEFLKKTRRALRKHMKAKFEEYERPQIKFQIQGSFSMGTVVNPLNGDYDIDDGLYFTPQLKNRPAPETAHNWVVKAAASYSNVDPPIDKKKCVRLPFRAGYHVDIPIYDLVSKNSEYLPELAVKGEGWKNSDPKELTNWFLNRVSKMGVQLKRLVRYFKAWADYQEQKQQTKMPNGLVLTILTTEEYQSSERDDEAFAETAKSIYERIGTNESILNPVDKSEDLRQRITDIQFNNFKNCLSDLVKHGEAALNHASAEEAAKKHWCTVLDDRFPVIEDGPNGDAKKPKKHEQGGLIGVSSKSAQDIPK